MPRKPALSLVSPPIIGGQPPGDLGEHGRALWNRVQAEFRIDDAGGVAVLMQACRMLDLAEEMAGAIARDGVVISGRIGPRVHPCVKEQILARNLVIRALRELGITLANVQASPGRPVMQLGYPDVKDDP